MDIPMLYTVCGGYRLRILGMSDIEVCEYTVILGFFYLALKLARKRQGKTVT